MSAEKAKPLIRLLRQREVTIKRLCRTVPISLQHFSHVLNGRRDGRHTWPKLRSYLTDEEREAVRLHYGEVFDP